MNLNKESLSYDDVLLVPRYSDIRSRSEIDISADLGKGVLLGLPIISAPMDTISETPMAIEMSKHRATAIIHRYVSLEKQARMIRMAHDLAKDPITVGAAIGITEDYIERAHAAVEAAASFLCVDVAHGHHILMKEALAALRAQFGDELHIMAGNVATLEGVNDLADWGADSVRCNIGGGSICSTRIQTGHGMPGFQTILDCAKADRDVKIIADGGIRNSGDIVKALAAGADAVMCGSLLAGTDETPGKVLEEKDGTRWKVYRGMASKEAQISWRGRYASHEGVSATVPYRGGVKYVLEDLERGIRSGLSYSGARTISQLQACASFAHQTPSGLTESRTHIVGRKW